jgi:hypothetical protein
MQRTASRAADRQTEAEADEAHAESKSLRKEGGDDNMALEYEPVLRASADRSRLERLNATPCTQDEAIAILEWLRRRHPLSTTLPLKLFFMGRRGRASRLVHADRLLITLPAGGKLLRVGLVLHEYAHHLAGLGTGHGPVFVQALDELALSFETEDAYACADTPDAAASEGPPLYTQYAKRQRCHFCGVNTTRKHSRNAYPCCGRCETAHALRNTIVQPGES